MTSSSVYNSYCAFCGKIKTVLNVVGQDLMCTECQKMMENPNEDDFECNKEGKIIDLPKH